MMEQILRIKYHTDPSSLSCILESFFDSIYSMYDTRISFIGMLIWFVLILFQACDGRLVYPHELRLLSNDNLFVFYAVMMDVSGMGSVFE